MQPVHNPEALIISIGARQTPFWTYRLASNDRERWRRLPFFNPAVDRGFLLGPALNHRRRVEWVGRPNVEVMRTEQVHVDLDRPRQAGPVEATFRNIPHCHRDSLH